MTTQHLELSLEAKLKIIQASEQGTLVKDDWLINLRPPKVNFDKLYTTMTSFYLARIYL